MVPIEYTVRVKTLAQFNHGCVGVGAYFILWISESDVFLWAVGLTMPNAKRQSPRTAKCRSPEWRISRVIAQAPARRMTLSALR